MGLQWGGMETRPVLGKKQGAPWLMGQQGPGQPHFPGTDAAVPSQQSRAGDGLETRRGNAKALGRQREWGRGLLPPRSRRGPQ